MADPLLQFGPRMTVLARYALALVFVAGASLMRWAFADILAPTPYLTFYPAVVAAAALGSFGPGLLATVASAAVVALVFGDPDLRWQPSMVLIRQAVFLSGGAGISAIAWGMHQMRHALEQRVTQRTAELRAAHESLLEEIRSVDAFFQHGITPLVVLDPQFNFIRVNEAYARYCGRAAADFPGHNHFEFFPDPVTEAIFREAVQSKSPFAANARPFAFPDRPESDLTYWNWTLVPVLDNRGDVDFLVLSLEDVTLQKHAEAELQEHGAHLEALVLQKSADLDAANTLLHEQAREMKALLAVTPLPVWVAHDRECQRVTGNLAASRLIGPGGDVNIFQAHSAGEATPVVRHYQNGRWLAANELPMQVAIATGREVLAEDIELHFADGRALHMTGAAAPLFDASGEVRGAIAAFADITARRHAEQALRASERRFALLAEVSSGLLASDDPRRIVNLLCHRVMEHLECHLFFNYVIDRDSGRLRLNASGGISEQTAREVEWLDLGAAVCGRVAQSGQRIIAECIQERPDPRTAFVRAFGICAYCCHPLLNQGRVIGTLSFGTRARDSFTDDEIALMMVVADQVAIAMERVALLQEAHRRQDEAETANKAKDHFLAVLSHELRTPLSPVLVAASHLLDDPTLKGQVHEDLLMIRRNVEMEAHLIDDLLDVTRIARGKISLDRRPVDLPAIVRRAASVCRSEVIAKGIQIRFDLGDASCVALGDAARLQQVFWNIVKNAVKFTPEGGRIEIRCRSTDRHVAIEVADTGIGIEAEAMSKLFRPFEQGNVGMTRQFGGLGLGLTISKAIVELHGGEITARSDGKGKGATFTVRLPLVVGSSTSGDGQDSLRPVAASRAPATPLRILLVEDHLDTARVVQRLLTRAGHAVQTAHNVATALDLIARHPFDLLLSDLGLPDASGLDLMRQIRHRYPIRAIALSGYGQEHDIQQSLEAGFALHLTKPVNPTRLQEAIAQITSTQSV